MTDRLMSLTERENRRQCPECGEPWENPSDSACPTCMKLMQDMEGALAAWQATDRRTYPRVIFGGPER